MDTTEFYELLKPYRSALERFVYYKMPSKTDGDDVLQEVYLTAIQRVDSIKDKNCFKPWVLRIAANKCSDFYRNRARQAEIPLNALTESTRIPSRWGFTLQDTVRETLDALQSKDKQILFLYYWKNKPQAEIAQILGIPVGTVKSRLHTARQNFKTAYPYPPLSKGADKMKTLPDILPDYTITKSDQEPFPVLWEELMGWFLIPRLGEALSWGIYEIPSRKRTHAYNMKVTGKAEVHGIEGVELTARETSYSEKTEIIERTFVAQLTDTHSRYLAAFRTEHGIRKYLTFLDGDGFLSTWGFGEDNCGNETHVQPKGIIRRDGNTITSPEVPSSLDVVGRYTVKIGGKSYDTTLIMDIELYNEGVMSETYLDQNGRTVLWRRFNRDDWAFDRYQKTWSEQLPENERVVINGSIYVQWYDCITDYIL